MTAATERYLIEAVQGRVDLCEQQGGTWITIRRNITPEIAARFGLNLDAPAVRKVFAAARPEGPGEKR
jgi:hypothetical protein